MSAAGWSVLDFVTGRIFIGFVNTSKMSRTCGHTHEKADGFFSQNGNGREAILGISRLDCLLAKAGETVNGGAFLGRSSCR